MLALPLAGCASGPAYPLLSPIALTRSFGYAETSVGGTHFSVSYVTPTRSTYSPADDAAARGLGLDMATWRAAQLAVAAGYAGFHVDDRQSDVTIFPDPLDLAYPASFWGPEWRRWRGPYWGAPGLWLPPRLYLAARISLEVTMLAKPGSRDVDAAATIDRLLLAYPGAEGGGT